MVIEGKGTNHKGLALEKYYENYGCRAEELKKNGKRIMGSIVEKLLSNRAESLFNDQGFLDRSTEQERR